MGLEIYFATSNPHKYSEAKKLLLAKGIRLEHFRFIHNEIRSDSLTEIAKEAVEAAYGELKKPVFTEDTGLFIDPLNGFPGTYSGWVQKKLGCEGILKLLHGEKGRGATFRTSIAFHNGKAIHIFDGACKGKIAEKEMGESGFGYDPIFMPEGHIQTFAQNIELKNKLSHRYKTLSKLSEFLLKAYF